MRGLSGATVVDNGDGLTVTKRGGYAVRTREQGEWILRNSLGSIFPKVYAILEDGYTMEKLEHVDYWTVTPDEMVQMLKNYVWCQPPTVVPTLNTRHLVLEKMHNNIDKWLGGLVSDSVKTLILDDAEVAATGSLKLRHCLSHGDPTAENVMLRPGFGTVLIDPIQATETIPDSPAVDIGKMLQSACGWEHAKYSTHFSAFTRSTLKDAVGDDELFEVGEAWATVHVIRAVPYVMRNMPDSINAVLSVLERAVERR